MNTIYLSIALISLSNPGLGGSAATRVKEGNRLFSEKKYEEALTKYNEAQVELPDSPEIYFNIGDVEYMKGSYGKSASLFQKSGEAGDRSLKSKASYNLGNTRYREDKLTEALAAYKEAIKLDPGDLDAKYNYELVSRKIEEQQQRQQEQKEREQKEKEQEQEQQRQEQNQQEQEQKEEQQEKEQEQEQQQQERQRQEKEQAAPRQEKQQEMQPEDVERLLDALQSEEEDQREIKMRNERRSLPEVLKDW